MSWAYAIALKGGARLISRQGEAVRELSAQSIVQSLGVSNGWLGAATYDGAVLLWDLESRSAQDSTGRDAQPPVTTLRSFCGSDGRDLRWSADGGGLAVSGTKAAVFDLTGVEVRHPYRKGGTTWKPRRGWPDPVPRVCMQNNPGAHHLSWAPLCEEDDAGASGSSNASARLATVDKQGVLRVWQPLSLPLRKGGNGNPHQPHLMKPQFYTFPRQDAAHPTGEAVEACSLIWLGADVVAVGYTTGELVAWRVAPTG